MKLALAMSPAWIFNLGYDGLFLPGGKKF